MGVAGGGNPRGGEGVGPRAPRGRAWVAERCDPYKDPIPEIPEQMLWDTSAVYVKAFEMITGQTFEAPAAGEPVIARLRRNLSQFF